ncbi:hypothetical protein ACFLY9_02850, partial [Patescibacteria group bacterium]
MKKIAKSKSTTKSGFKVPSLNIAIIITIALVTLATFLLFEYKVTDGQLGAPLDDVFIHFQFSKNIAEGNGFSFNANQPTSGSTSPAWTLLITPFYLLVKNHLLIAKVLSTVFFIFSGITTYFLGLEILKSKKYSLIAAIFTLSTGRLAWSALSGMEVTLFTFLITLFLLLYLKRKSKYLLMFLLGIASTVRPEGYLIAVFYFLILIIQLIKSLGSSRSKRFNRSLTSHLKVLLISGFIYLAIITPYLVFSYITTGSFLPNTFNAQSISDLTFAVKIKHALLYILRFGYLLIIDNPIIGICLPFGIYSLIKKLKTNGKYFLLILIAVGFPLLASITAPNLRHHGRYTIPFTPLYVIIGLIGIRYILEKLRYKITHLQRKFKYFVLSSVLIYLTVMLFNWADTYAWNVKNINDMHVKLGNWVKDNTPEDSIIALNDIGAITYFSQREIIDIIGLVSPEILVVKEGLTKQESEQQILDFII